MEFKDFGHALTNDAHEKAKEARVHVWVII